MASARTMRLPGPVAVTVTGSMPAAAKRVAAEGITRAWPVGAEAAGAGAGAPTASEAFCSTGAAAAGATATEASVSITAITSPELTVWPFWARISANCPAEGAGTSSTTLSVSISMRMASASITSPGLYFHSRSVASLTDSESSGTLT